MLKVGLTGGIGSGKSTVARVFEILGVPVYYADEAARRLINTDPAIRAAIIATFGETSYVNNQLNRPYISSIVFNQPAQLTKLNAITHPATIRDAASWMQQQTAPYSIKEAALLFESNAHLELDCVIGVYAPLDLRRQRVMLRDGLSMQEVDARISKQMKEELKMERCDYILHNDEKELLLPQIISLHETLLKRAKK